jgi:hypothetical protein
VKKAWDGSWSSLYQGLDGFGGDATAATTSYNRRARFVTG